jgi:fumarylpyruvate hydrolase
MSYVFNPPTPAAVPVVGSDAKFPVNRVYCVGRNYVEHAKEMGFTGREPPFFFMKPADALVVVPEGSTAEIPYPAGTKDLHHEIELVVAIGVGGRDIAAADAGKHIFGYAIGLDMTRRDLQGEAKKLGRPWEIGKAFDQSAPIGPIRRAAEVPGASAAQPITQAAISLKVNGTTRQSSNVTKLIWSIAESIEYLSKFWELKPGDLIFTGTPEGVAAVKSGDLMQGHLEGIGDLKVRVV